MNTTFTHEISFRTLANGQYSASSNSPRDNYLTFYGVCSLPITRNTLSVMCELVLIDNIEHHFVAELFIMHGENGKVDQDDYLQYGDRLDRLCVSITIYKKGEAISTNPRIICSTFIPDDLVAFSMSHESYKKDNSLLRNAYLVAMYNYKSSVHKEANDTNNIEKCMRNVTILTMMSINPYTGEVLVVSFGIPIPRETSGKYFDPVRTENDTDSVHGLILDKALLNCGTVSQQGHAGMDDCSVSFKILFPEDQEKKCTMREAQMFSDSSCGNQHESHNYRDIVVENFTRFTDATCSVAPGNKTKHSTVIPFSVVETKVMLVPTVCGSRSEKSLNANRLNTDSILSGGDFNPNGGRSAASNTFADTSSVFTCSPFIGMSSYACCVVLSTFLDPFPSSLTDRFSHIGVMCSVLLSASTSPSSLSQVLVPIYDLDHLNKSKTKSERRIYTQQIAHILSNSLCFRDDNITPKYSQVDDTINTETPVFNIQCIGICYGISARYFSSTRVFEMEWEHICVPNRPIVIKRLNDEPSQGIRGIFIPSRADVCMFPPSTITVGKIAHPGDVGRVIVKCRISCEAQERKCNSLGSSMNNPSDHSGCHIEYGIISESASKRECNSIYSPILDFLQFKFDISEKMPFCAVGEAQSYMSEKNISSLFAASHPLVSNTTSWFKRGRPKLTSFSPPKSQITNFGTTVMCDESTRKLKNPFRNFQDPSEETAPIDTYISRDRALSVDFLVVPLHLHFQESLSSVNGDVPWNSLMLLVFPERLVIVSPFHSGGRSVIGMRHIPIRCKSVYFVSGAFKNYESLLRMGNLISVEEDIQASHSTVVVATRMRNYMNPNNSLHEVLFKVVMIVNQNTESIEIVDFSPIITKSPIASVCVTSMANGGVGVDPSLGEGDISSLSSSSLCKLAGRPTIIKIFPIHLTVVNKSILSAMMGVLLPQGNDSGLSLELQLGIPTISSSSFIPTGDTDQVQFAGLLLEDGSIRLIDLHLAAACGGDSQKLLALPYFNITNPPPKSAWGTGRPSAIIVGISSSPSSQEEFVLVCGLGFKNGAVQFWETVLYVPSDGKHLKPAVPKFRYDGILHNSPVTHFLELNFFVQPSGNSGRSQSMTTMILPDRLDFRFLSISRGGGTVCLHQRSTYEQYGMISGIISEHIKGVYIDLYSEYCLVVSEESGRGVLWHLISGRLERYYYTTAEIEEFCHGSGKQGICCMPITSNDYIEGPDRGILYHEAPVIKMKDCGSVIVNIQSLLFILCRTHIPNRRKASECTGSITADHDDGGIFPMCCTVGLNLVVREALQVIRTQNSSFRVDQLYSFVQNFLPVIGLPNDMLSSESRIIKKLSLCSVSNDALMFTICGAVLRMAFKQLPRSREGNDENDLNSEFWAVFSPCIIPILLGDTIENSDDTSVIACDSIAKRCVKAMADLYPFVVAGAEAQITTPGVIKRFGGAISHHEYVSSITLLSETAQDILRELLRELTSSKYEDIDNNKYLFEETMSLCVPGPFSTPFLVSLISRDSHPSMNTISLEETVTRMCECLQGLIISFLDPSTLSKSQKELCFGFASNFEKKAAVLSSTKERCVSLVLLLVAQQWPNAVGFFEKPQVFTDTLFTKGCLDDGLQSAGAKAFITILSSFLPRYRDNICSDYMCTDVKYREDESPGESNVFTSDGYELLMYNRNSCWEILSNLFHSPATSFQIKMSNLHHRVVILNIITRIVLLFPSRIIASEHGFSTISGFILHLIDPHSPNRLEREAAVSAVADLFRVSVQCLPFVTFQQKIQRLAYGKIDGTVRVIDARSANEITLFSAFSEKDHVKNSCRVTCTDKTSVVPSSIQRGQVLLHPHSVICVTYSPISHDIAVLPADLSCIRIFSASANATSTVVGMLFSLSAPFSHFKFKKQIQLIDIGRHNVLTPDEAVVCRLVWLSPHCVQLTSPYHDKEQFII